MSLSPSGRTVVAGTHLGFLYVYDINSTNASATEVAAVPVADAPISVEFPVLSDTPNGYFGSYNDKQGISSFRLDPCPRKHGDPVSKQVVKRTDGPANIITYTNCDGQRFLSYMTSFEYKRLQLGRGAAEPKVVEELMSEQLQLPPRHTFKIFHRLGAQLFFSTQHDAPADGHLYVYDTEKRTLTDTKLTAEQFQLNEEYLVLADNRAAKVHVHQLISAQPFRSSLLMTLSLDKPPASWPHIRMVLQDNLLVLQVSITDLAMYDLAKRGETWHGRDVVSGFTDFCVDFEHRVIIVARHSPEAATDRDGVALHLAEGSQLGVLYF